MMHVGDMSPLYESTAECVEQWHPRSDLHVDGLANQHSDQITNPPSLRPPKRSSCVIGFAYYTLGRKMKVHLRLRLLGMSK
jgi:hypothetical protein